jgi:hypothetical protein
MATNKRDLKAYARFDGTGRIVPGSLVLRRNKPKVGNWIEVQAYECCDPLANDSGYTCCIAIQVIADGESGQYELTLQTRNGGPNLTGSIHWSSTESESFSFIAEGEDNSLSHFFGDTLPHTVYLCIDNPSQIRDFEIGFGPGQAIAISNLHLLEGINEWDGDNMLFTSLDFTGITSIRQILNDATGLQHINITGCVNLNEVRLVNNDLTQTSVDHVLVTLDDSGLTGGLVDLGGGTNAAPSVAGAAAAASLILKGWSVTVNP